MDTLAADLCATAMAMTDATGAVLGSWAGETGTVLAVAGGDGGPRPGDSFTAPESELGLAVRAETILVRSAHEWKHGRTSVAGRDESWTHRPRAMAALPLRSARGTVGVLAVWSSAEAAFEEDSLQLLHALAPYAALHMDQAREFDHLRESAEQDPLTGLRNRRAFENVLAAETGRFERYGQRLALLVMDLDHFKAVNDTYGHEAGDEVLRNVARLISGCVRDVDTAARIGGEEFVVLLPETSMDAAADVAERIRAAVAAASIDWKGTVIPIRISIGVSACPGAAQHPRDLLGTADAALDTAKEAGRDRVVRATGVTDAARPGQAGAPAQLGKA
jgi:diguanylate cyclase (GGDEF)-like protein